MSPKFAIDFSNIKENEVELIKKRVNQLKQHNQINVDSLNITDEDEFLKYIFCHILTGISHLLSQNHRRFVILPEEATEEEISTGNAAKILKVSRPFLVKLLDKGKIPSRKVGRYRRILFSDLMAYKEKEDEKRLKALEELQAQAQKLNMGYDD